VFADPSTAVVVTAEGPDHPAFRRLVSRGIAVWSLPGRRKGLVDIPRLLKRLSDEGITSLMVEGGAVTLWEFFRAGAVDRVAVFLAPRLVGGAGAPGPIAGAGFDLARTPRLEDAEWERVGDDFLLTARVS